MKSRMLMMSFCMIAGASIFGQTAPQRATVPFQFSVGKKVLPAGQYEVSHEKESTPFVTLRTADGKSAVQLHVITLLAKEKTSSDKTVRLVFDTVGDQRFLSEVWIPGQEGLLVHTTKGSHKHATVASAE